MDLHQVVLARICINFAILGLWGVQMIIEIWIGWSRDCGDYLDTFSTVIVNSDHQKQYKSFQRGIMFW